MRRGSVWSTATCQMRAQSGRALFQFTEKYPRKMGKSKATIRLDELSDVVAFRVELGERLARERTRRGMSQAELARRARLHRNTIHVIEAGRTVTVASLFQVMNVLGLLSAFDEAIPNEVGPMIAGPLTDIELGAPSGRSRHV